DELNEIQTYEHGKADLPGSGLDEHEKCGEYGRNQRTKKRYVVQNKGDDAPRGREFDAGNQGKTPHHDARQQAHRGPHDHVFLEFFRNLFSAYQKRSTERRAVQMLDISSREIDFQQSEHNESKSYNDKGYEAVAPAADLADRADDPSRIVAVGHKIGD